MSDPCPNCALRPRLLTSVFCGPCTAEKAGVPLRTARDLFEIAGHEAMLLEEYPRTALVVVAGKGGPCVMLSGEWHAYRNLCVMWFELPRDTEGADPLAETQAGKPRLPAADLLRIIAACLQATRMARTLVEAALQTLSVEDYEDCLRGALERQSLTIGCLEKLSEELGGLYHCQPQPTIASASEASPQLGDERSDP